MSGSLTTPNYGWSVPAGGDAASGLAGYITDLGNQVDQAVALATGKFAAQYSQPNSQNIPNDSNYHTLTGWVQELPNTLGGSLSAGAYSIPSAMTCEISAAASILNGATEYRLAVFVNGTKIRQARAVLGSVSTGAVTIPITAFAWQFAAGDVVAVEAWANAAGISTTAGATETWWRMKRIA